MIFLVYLFIIDKTGDLFYFFCIHIYVCFRLLSIEKEEKNKIESFKL